MAKYRSAPVAQEKMPSGIPYIIGNEGAERFSFYGMKGILVVFMTKHLMGSDGELNVMSEADATSWCHVFNMAVYLTPLAGSLCRTLFWENTARSYFSPWCIAWVTWRWP